MALAWALNAAWGMGGVLLGLRDTLCGLVRCQSLTDSRKGGSVSCRDGCRCRAKAGAVGVKCTCMTAVCNHWDECSSRRLCMAASRPSTGTTVTVGCNGGIVCMAVPFVAECAPWRL
jgi:hypothetical protein